MTCYTDSGFIAALSAAAGGLLLLSTVAISQEVPRGPASPAQTVDSETKKSLAAFKAEVKQLRDTVETHNNEIDALAKAVRAMQDDFGTAPSTQDK